MAGGGFISFKIGPVANLSGPHLPSPLWLLADATQLNSDALSVQRFD